MEILGKSQCKEKYKLTEKWFSALLIEGYFTKLERNKYALVKPFNLYEFKESYRLAKIEKIRKSNIEHAKSLSPEEKKKISKVLSDAQKKYFSDINNRKKHQERQKQVMGSEKIRKKISKSKIEFWRTVSEENRLKFKNTISNAVKRSWSDSATRKNRIEGLREAYAKRKEDIIRKINRTKAINGTYCTSIPANDCIRTLLNKGYTLELEKPYPGTDTLHCDIYIKELDMWIELHFFWTHGKMPFDNSNPEHLQILENYRCKHTAQYDCAVYTWSYLDVKKKKLAEKHNLNYHCFYTMKSFNEFLIQNNI